MSILGAIVRVKPAGRAATRLRLTSLPGVDLGIDPDDGRFVVVIEDAMADDGTPHPAAATLAAIATWPEVLSTSLVYEYSGPDAPPIVQTGVGDYRAWRGSLQDLARGAAAPGPSRHESRHGSTRD